MLGIKLQDRVPCKIIRQKTGVTDVIKHATKLKWKWAGHVARFTDNRWTKRCTDWRPRNGYRTRGRPTTRWHDDIAKHKGFTWSREAQNRENWRFDAEGYIQQWMDNA